MLRLDAIAALRAQLEQWRAAGQRIALVPTMGNLHRGHLALLARARELGDRVVATVFVNPLQFGPDEDYARYPRTLEADAGALAQAGCDLLFAPPVEVMYPRGRSAVTMVRVPEVSEPLEGEHRPGHFDGVATVVNLLFNLVQPDIAVFGEKDYQQLLVIRRMVADLKLPVRIEGLPTVREPDGLALSSRNQYLSAAERATAPALSAALREVATALQAGRRDFAALEAAALAQLRQAGFKPQYLAIRQPDLHPPAADSPAYVVLAAAYLGSTRLIDNCAAMVG